MVQSAEDEVALTEIIREAVIESVEKLFLSSGDGNSLRSLRLKNIAFNWLFLVHNAMVSVRGNKDQVEETSRYMNMFSNSSIPYHLINWLISQGEVIRDADTLLDLTPAFFTECLYQLKSKDYGFLTVTIPRTMPDSEVKTRFQSRSHTAETTRGDW